MATLVAAFLHPAGAWAQDTAAASPPPLAPAPGGSPRAVRGALAPPPAASPFVPPDHWAWAAARRLHALGFAPNGFDRGRSLRTRRELAWLFERAVEAAARDRPAVARLARGYADRFREEFGDGLDGADPVSGSARVAVAVAAGYERLTGRAGGGVGYFSNDWTGARPIPDTTGAFLEAEASVVTSRHLSLRVEPVLRAAGPALRGGEAVVVLGPIGAWAGRRAFSFGPGEDGGIVLGPHVPLDGFGAFLAQPIHFPWLLRAMGPIQIESFLSKTYGGDRIRDPYFIGFHGTFAPHPRLTVGVNRGAMFAGRGNEPITLDNMLFLIRGGVGNTGRGDTGAFANDMVSMDFTYRPPTDPTLPLVTWLEWGMDDAAGMWHRYPGIVAGVRAGLVPGAPWLSIGVQGTSLARVEATNGIWYRNFALRQGWTDYGVPLGQQLAGAGRELRVSADADLLDARLRVGAAAFSRLRRDQNLLAPERAGTSRGGALRLAARLAPAFDLRLDAAAEHGDGWTTGALSASLRWLR